MGLMALAMARREAVRSEAVEQTAEEVVVGEEAELATAAAAMATSLGEEVKRTERAMRTGAVKDSAKMRAPGHSARMCQAWFGCHPFRWRTQ